MSAHSIRVLHLATLVILLLGAVAGCSNKASVAEPKGGPKTCMVVLFDLSKTTKGQVIRQRYFEEFGTVLKACNGGEAIVGDAITDNPLAEGSFPIDRTLPSYSPLTANHDDYEVAKTDAIRRIEDQARVLVLDHPGTNKTDIFDALLLAEKIFNGEQFGKAPHKALIIFSDMRQDGAGYKFDQLDLTTARAQKILAELKSRGQLPNLAGVKVWVAGAGVSDDTPRSAGQILATQRFWIAYFKACGADLTPERYGPALINFALPSA
jgi:hypothetical protein